MFLNKEGLQDQNKKARNNEATMCNDEAIMYDNALSSRWPAV